MNKPKVYIDGSEGTTGLRIHSRLPGRNDIELMTIDPEKRKDPAARRELREEIGYDASEAEMEQVACLRRTNSFCGVFSLRIDWPAEQFVLQPEEVSAVQWCDSARLTRMVAENALYNYGDAYFRMLFEYGRRAR